MNKKIKINLTPMVNIDNKISNRFIEIKNRIKKSRW